MSQTRTPGQEHPVRDYLRRSGAPYSVVAQGLRGLVENWERVVDQVVAGYHLGLDDYFLIFARLPACAVMSEASAVVLDAQAIGLDFGIWRAYAAPGTFR